MSKILFEPFKIKVVEALPLSTESERKLWIEEAGFNVFALDSHQVTIDLLTDSGTSAMSDQQWSEMHRADEAYAGSRSFRELEVTAQEITGMKHIIPVHQGRAAEHLLFSSMLKGGEIIPSNGLFDTTLANIESCGATGMNLPCAAAADPFTEAPFKGNIDTEKLRSLLEEESKTIPFVLMTLTNNTGGGQPVSFANVKTVKEIADTFGKPLIIDACRFAENSYFIKTREEGELAQCSPLEISQQCFALADAVTFSGKKDAFANIGGLLCLRSDDLANSVKNEMLVVEGFPTYGGLAGYSLAAMNQGLKEVLDERYLQYRLRTIGWMVEQLQEAGVPVLVPAGGHAVYIEAARFFDHLDRKELPGIALTTELFLRGGIRAVELGTVAFGKRDENGNHIHPPFDLVRLAVPRRVYTEAHMGFVVETLIELFKGREGVRGFDFEKEFPVMRHFRSRFKRL